MTRPQRIALLLVLLFGLALVAGVVLGTRHGLGPRPGWTEGGPGAARAATREPAEERPQASANRAAPGARAADETGRSEASATAAELTGATWIEGAVRIPPETPAGEEAWVSSRTKVHGPVYHRALVGPDGRFRIALPDRAREGWIDLEARFLYLPQRKRVRVATVRKLTLEPRLGSEVALQLLLPPGASEEDLAGAEVKLLTHEDSGQGWDTVREEARVSVAGPRVVLRGQPSAERAEIELESDRFVPASLDHLVLAAGQTEEVELALRLGVRIGGHVLGPDGEPVAGALVEGRRKQESWSPFRKTRTAEDGSYALGGLEPGEAFEFEVKKEGFVSIEEERGPFELGGDASDVDFTLEPGLGVAGRVLWPDGTPAAAAWLEVRPSPETEGYQAWKSKETTQVTHLGPDGAFDLAGLEGGLWVLRAWAPRPQDDPSPAVDLSTLSVRERRELRKRERERPVWHARVESVPAGTRDLEMVLAPGQTLAGRVQDDLGAPIERFVVQALPQRPELPVWERAQNGVSDRFRSEEGAFELKGLEPGEWAVSASAAGHGRSREQRVHVPGARQELILILPRAARIRGRVVGRDGKPMAEASVHAVAKMRDSWGNESETHWKDSTDAEGLFDMDGVRPGVVTLSASAPGWGPSPGERLQLEPGETRSGVELVLDRAGSIAGQVVDPSGGGLAERYVSAMRVGTEDRDWTQTDSGGGFAFRGLSPGRYLLSSEPGEKEQEALRDDDGNVPWNEYQAGIAQQTVELGPGESLRVVLSTAGRQETRVYGVVTSGGQPQSGVQIRVEPFGRRQSKNRREARTGTDGRYEVTVTEPGRYAVDAASAAGGWIPHEVPVEIPAGARAVRCDVELPEGSITGRVILPDRSPAAGVRVTPHGAPIAGRGWGQGWTTGVTSAQNGSFEIGNLAPGEYELIAGAADSPHLGRVAGVRVEAGGETRIEIVVSPSGSIAGTVRDEEGWPVSGARLVAFTAGGTVLNPTGVTKSDDAGRFRLDGLPAEEVRVRAVAAGLVNERDVPVEVPAGGTATAELVLEAGTNLVIAVLGPDGQPPAEVDLRVLDAAGTDQAPVGSYGYQESISASRRVGPLPPGTYRVVAELPDGSRGSELVTVAGQLEVAVTVRAR